MDVCLWFTPTADSELDAGPLCSLVVVDVLVLVTELADSVNCGLLMGRLDIRVLLQFQVVHIIYSKFCCHFFSEPVTKYMKGIVTVTSGYAPGAKKWEMWWLMPHCYAPDF